MRITADTNLFVRVILGDDIEQSKIAARTLSEAELVAVTIPSLCELVWVLSRGHKASRKEIATTIQALIESESVRVDRPAVEAGLAMLHAGGDFADGAIAFEGRKLGGTIFASFDREAVAKVRSAGGEAMLAGGE